MRDGNQYIKTERITPVLVGASRVEGLVRPWNPYSFFNGIHLTTEFETARFRDADADFIAAAPTDIAALITEVKLLRVALLQVGKVVGP